MVMEVEMVLTEKVGQAAAAVVRLLMGHEPVGLLPPSVCEGHEPQWPVLLVEGLMTPPVPVASTGQMVVETATTSVLVTAWPLFLGQSLTSSGHWVTV